MANEALSHCYIHQREVVDSTTPNSLSVPSFIFSWELRHVTTSERRVFQVSQQEFVESASSITRRMLSDIGLLSLEYINNQTPRITDVIWEIAARPCNSGARVLAFSLSIIALTIPERVHTFTLYDDDDDDDDRILERILMESADQDFQTMPATKSSIEALEEVKIESLDTTTTMATDDCRICLEELLLPSDFDDHDKKKTLVRLPCSHLFHKDCIVRWLETSHFCPLCRFDMPS
ncbi:hypothetical protein UlMin_000827 [Ulmus minor]